MHFAFYVPRIKLLTDFFQFQYGFYFSAPNIIVSVKVLNIDGFC